MEFPPPPVILSFRFIMGFISAKEYARLMKLWKEKHGANKNG